MTVVSSLGRLDVTGVTERLELSTSNRRVTVADISGEVMIATSNSSIVASDIRTGDQQARFRNESGDIKIDGMQGLVNIRNKYGRIDIAGFIPGDGTNFLRGSYGPIILELEEMAEGKLIVNNSFEDIEFRFPDTLSATMSLTVEENEGEIEVSGVKLQTELVRSNRLNLIMGTGRAEISTAVRGAGNIYIQGFSSE
jgi:hypothetical protein